MANPVAIVRTGRHAGRHVRRHAERHVALIIAAGLAKDRSHRDHKRHGGVGAVTQASRATVSRRGAAAEPPPSRVMLTPPSRAGAATGCCFIEWN